LLIVLASFIAPSIAIEPPIEAIEASIELYRHSSSLHRTVQTGQVGSDYLFYLNVTGPYCAIGHKTNILLMKAVIQCNTDSTLVFEPTGVCIMHARLCAY
jgi:hypothetical protein